MSARRQLDPPSLKPQLAPPPNMAVKPDLDFVTERQIEPLEFFESRCGQECPRAGAGLRLLRTGMSARRQLDPASLTVYPLAR